MITVDITDVYSLPVNETTKVTTGISNTWEKGGLVDQLLATLPDSEAP